MNRSTFSRIGLCFVTAAAWLSLPAGSAAGDPPSQLDVAVRAGQQRLAEVAAMQMARLLTQGSRFLDFRCAAQTRP